MNASVPCGVLLLGGAPVPDGIETFRADARATGHNLRVLRAATRWLHEGGALVILRGPEGSAPLRSRVAEARWGELVRRLAAWSEATVVPAYVTVPGSRLQRLGRRLLPASLTHARETGSVCIGDALPTRKLRAFGSGFEVSRFLRLRIGLLSACAPGRCRGNAQAEREHPAIAPGPSADTLAEEISGLDEGAHLLDSGEMSVYCARASELPNVLREIGRLRETTFRAVGEGTGGDVDLDVYDDYYLQLFIWHHGNREIVGGYRLGLADEILARFGKTGLYSHSLFRYRTRLIEHIGPAIEMGRSFVQPAYQREFASLLLLWKGICRFVSRNPRYRVLFGPVSISADYATLSQQLLVDFLTLNRSDGVLAREVRPRRRFRGRTPAPWRRAPNTRVSTTSRTCRS
ncbi:MAG: lysophospholipid acyltransferase family protein [Halofilum sp. (in: g-proteobacteria)]|nr:lysophospholipid acyltransferase family protein [Halofilum sp. (in: g-proteobacteria)]